METQVGVGASGKFDARLNAFSAYSTIENKVWNSKALTSSASSAFGPLVVNQIVIFQKIPITLYFDYTKCLFSWI